MDRKRHNTDKGFWPHRETMTNPLKFLPSGHGSFYFERVLYEPIPEPSREEDARMIRAFRESDNPGIWFMLGTYYMAGRGVLQSRRKAVWWFLRSADGWPKARIRLQACFAFYKAAPWQYAEAYAIAREHSQLFGHYLGTEMWRTMTLNELAEGLRRLTEYEKKISGV